MATPAFIVASPRAVAQPAPSPITSEIASLFANAVYGASQTGDPTTPVTPNPLTEALWAAYRQSASSTPAASVTSVASVASVAQTSQAATPGGSPTVVATIPVDPYQIALSPDGGRLYGTSSPLTASSQGAGTLEVIDTATNTQVGDPIPIGLYPEYVAVNPTTNRAYVTALQSVTFTANGQQIPGGSDGLVVIDTTTNEVVGAPILLGASQNGSQITETGVAGPSPLGSNVVVSPDGSRAYIAETTYSVDTSNPSSATFQPNIYVIDTKTNTQVGNPIPIGPPVTYSPSNFVLAGPVLISPSGDRLYVNTLNISNGGGPLIQTITIRPIDPSTGASLGPTVSIVDDNGSPLAVASEVLSPDGKKLYVEAAQTPTPTGQGSNDQQIPNGTVLTYDTTTGQQTGTPINLTGYGALAVSPDGKTLYVADISDSRTGKTGTVPGTNQTMSVGSITAYDANTGQQTAAPVTVGLYPSSLAINSTGTKLYVANAADNTISVINITPAKPSSGGTGQEFGQPAPPPGTGTPTPAQVLQGVLATVQSTINRVANTFVQLIGSLLSSVAAPVHPVQSPTATADLYQRLRDKTDNSPNSIWIDKISAKDGTRYVVYFGGTIPSSHNPSQATLGNNIPAYNGVLKTNQLNIILNRISAVDPKAKVMLVGYSQGGLDAQNVAEKVPRNLLNVTTVVLFAAPLIYGPPTAYRQIDIGAYADPVVADFTKQPQTQQNIDKHDTFGAVTADYKSYSSQWWFNPLWDFNMHGDPATYLDAGKQFDAAAKSGKVQNYADVRSNELKFAGTVQQSWNS